MFPNLANKDIYNFARELYFHSDFNGFYSSGRDCGRSLRPIR